MALYVVYIQNLIRRHVIMSSCHHAVKDSLILKADISTKWRKRSIPTHSEWLYPLTFDAGNGLKEA